MKSLWIALVLITAGPAAAGEPPVRIDDFEDQDLEATPGLSWAAIGDWLVGGPSTGAIRVARGALHFEGHLRKGGKGEPFVGVWTALRGDGLPRDVKAYRGLRFRVRGVPGRYLAGVRRQEKTGAANLMAPFQATSAWSDVELSFADLRPNPPAASGLGFAPSGIAFLGFANAGDSPPDFNLEIDDVELVPEVADEPLMRKLALTLPRALDRVAFTTIGRDERGDTVSPRLPDARELQLGVEPGGRVWFRFVLQDPPPADYFGLNVALDVDGDPKNGQAWWGQNKEFHFDRVITVYLNRGGRQWEGFLGVADVAQLADRRPGGTSTDVRVVVDRARHTLAVGVPRASLGLPAGGAVRLIGTVGSNFTFNDDLPASGALDVVIPESVSE